VKGFSTTTCLPASRAAFAKLKCTSFDVAVYIKTANFPIKQEYGILDSIWERREELLAAKYNVEKK